MAPMSKDLADDPLYLRGVLAADLKESDVIANNDEAEVRYNISSGPAVPGRLALRQWLCRPTHLGDQP